MKELVRCKPCGYVGEKSKMGDTCPACGVSHKLFEPYKDRMKPNRRKILDLDLHPIAVHFPQTIAVFILQFVLLNIVFPDFKAHEVEAFIVFLSVLLPFSVFGAFVSGIIDAKVRFKKLSPRALVGKIIWGSIMIVTSTAVALCATMIEYDNTAKYLILGTSIITMAIAVWLAVVGKKLMYSEMPG